MSVCLLIIFVVAEGGLPFRAAARLGISGLSLPPGPSVASWPAGLEEQATLVLVCLNSI